MVGMAFTTLQVSTAQAGDDKSGTVEEIVNAPETKAGSEADMTEDDGMKGAMADDGNNDTANSAMQQAASPVGNNNDQVETTMGSAPALQNHQPAEGEHHIPHTQAEQR